MTEKEFYAAIGGNYEEALTRLMRDSLIRKFVGKFPADTSFETLKAAMVAEDWDAAFSAAHTLKGVSLNLAFAALGKAASDLTEALRPQNRTAPEPERYRALFSAVSANYETVLAAIRTLTEA